MPDSIGSRLIGAAVAKTVRDHWALFLVEGIALVILGVLAIIVPTVATLAATAFFGWLLMISGVIGLLATIRARHAPGFGWSLASAAIGIAAGVLLLGWPIQGSLSLTAILVAFLAMEGVASILYAFEHRKGASGRWNWMLASGIVDLVLSAILLAGLPGTAFWALGLLVGINLLFGGWCLIVMALHARGPSAATA